MLIMDDVYKILWEKVSPEIINKLSSGAAKIAPSGGVVYENGRILTHLPLEKIQGVKELIPNGPFPFIDTASKLVSNVQLNKIQKDITHLLNLSKVNIGVTICSAAVVVAAIVVATKYLANKIDNLESKINELQQILNEITDQEFIKYLCDYKACMLNLQPYYEKDIKNDQMCINLLSNLSQNRAKLILISHQLAEKIQFSTSKEYIDIVYNFLNNFIDMLPSSMMMEYTYYCKLEKFDIADSYANQTYTIYNQIRTNILKFLYDQKLKMVHGKKYLIEISMDNLKAMNKIGEGDFVAAIPQGVPTATEVIETIGSKIYLPK